MKRFYVFGFIAGILIGFAGYSIFWWSDYSDRQRYWEDQKQEMLYLQGRCDD